MKTRVVLITYLTLFLLTSFSLADEQEYPEENNVLVLTDVTAEQAINKYDFIMVVFYAPWCMHCKSLMPEFNAAAEIMKKRDPPVPMGKIDITQHEGALKKFNVHGYPSIRLYMNGKPIDYNWGYMRKDLEVFIDKRAGDVIRKVDSDSAMQEFVGPFKFMLGFLGSDPEKLQVFEEFCIENYEVRCVQCYTEECISRYNARDGSIVLLKEHDERKHVYKKEVTKDILRRFIKKFSLKRLYEYDHIANNLIFVKKKPAILILRKDEEKSDFTTVIQFIANKFRGDLMVVELANKTPHEDNVCNYLGIKTADLPTARILDSASGEMVTYKLDGGVNQDDLEKFIETWKAGKLAPELLSQPIPIEQDLPYYVLVGKTFEEFAYDSSKDVVVLFKAEKEHCPICDAAISTYEQVANRLKGNPNLLVASLDLKMNSIKNHPNINKFPSIFLWKATDKTKSIQYDDSVNSPDQIIKFLRKYSRHSIKDSKDDEEKKADDEFDEL